MFLTRSPVVLLPSWVIQGSPLESHREPQELEFQAQRGLLWGCPELSAGAADHVCWTSSGTENILSDTHAPV